MPTAKDYRQQAQQCLELAKAAKDSYTKQAMTELAEEFNKAADTLERKSAVQLLGKPMAADLCRREGQRPIDVLNGFPVRRPGPPQH